ncbi:hypothetical protein [Falsiroseomonas sp.]|uniref:hypothetical protein n=1 Tax=Falsiroseomonas sp. TaxID=2870721 RepID=UPI00356A13F8
MAKKTTAGDSGTAVFLEGDAYGTGGDTLSYVSVDLSVTTKTNGQTKVKATGEVTALAVAEAGEDGNADTTAFTSAYSTEADKVKIRTTETTFEEDGVSYSYSVTTIKVTDSDKEKEPKISYKEKSKELSEAYVDIDGNLALAEFDVNAEGPETLADVDSHVLALDDGLSQSTVLATAAVDWSL